MKKILFLLCIFLFITNCTTQNKSSNSNSEATIKPELNDDGEYELHVLDSEYDYFLMTKARSVQLNFIAWQYTQANDRAWQIIIKEVQESSSRQSLQLCVTETDDLVFKKWITRESKIQTKKSEIK